MLHSNLEIVIPRAEGQLMWHCLEMAGPEGQSSGGALPSRVSTEWRKLCLEFSLFLAGSRSYREDAEAY